MNFVWTIDQLFVKKTEGGFSDVVINANWKCSGTDGAYSASVPGCSEFAPPSSDFTPYDDLTEEQVLGWVWTNGVDKNAAEAAVAQQIENQINPPVIAPPLPWLPPVVVAHEAPVVEAPTV